MRLRLHFWSPAPTVYFEATISNSNAGSTAYAVLAFSSCSTLIDSEVSTTNSTYTRVRSNSFTPTAGRNYFVCIKASANTAKIANAKIILEQSSASGVSKLETTQVYNNTYIQTTDTSYARINYNNLFDPANFTPRTVSYYFEIYGDSDFLDAWIKVKDETTPADITNGEINIPGASTDARRRSSALSMPTTSKTLDVEHKALTGNTAKTNVAWLVIQIDMTLSLEQQINMIDQEYTTASTTLAPTDYSLGIIHWDDDKFSNISTVTFEALICNTGYTSGKDQIAVTTTATLMEITSSPDVEVASVTYLINNCGYALQTVDVTADAQFLDDKDYTVQIKTDNASGTAQIKAARLKVVQSSGGWITDTQTQVEVGNNQTAFTNTTYSALTHYKIYQYNDSVFTPSPVTSPGDVEFQATLKIASAGDTVHAELYNNTNSTSVAEVSHTGDTTWTLKTGTNVDGDADWDTTNDDNYIVRVKCTDGNGGGCSGSISNAKIVLNQSDGTNGVTDLETVQQYANSNVSCACAGIYGDDVYDNTFVPANFGGTKAYFFESTIKTSAGTGYSRLKNDTDSSAITGSEVSTASTTYVRQRSGDITANMPASSKRMDSQKNVTSPNTVNLASAWLIIQISSMPVPEALLFAAPALIFVPKLVEWIKQRRLKNKEKIVMVLPV
ncbi:MAG: hypothetical protein Q8P25_00855 [Candidatus Curtissbacteria bacterium]|nr:hypothetical protein [Candidatus Curtissbacteria bacterium]